MSETGSGLSLEAAFFEQAADFFLVLGLADHTIMRANASFTTFVASADMVIGASFPARFLHDDSRKAFDAALAIPEEGPRFECQVLVLDQTQDNAMPRYEAVEWTIRIDHQQKLVFLVGRSISTMSRARSSAEAEFCDFFDKAPIAMHWLGADGCILWANQTEMDTLGYTKEEYIGKSVMDFCPDEKELVLEIFQQLGSGSSIQDVPVRFRAKDGSIKHLLIDSNVKWKTSSTGERAFDHTRCFIRDDTRRKISQAEIRAEGKLEQRQLMFSQINHDLRSPLNAIIGFTNLMLGEQETLSVDHQEYVKCVSGSAGDMLEIVNNVLDAANGGEITKPVLAEMNLIKTLENAVNMMSVNAGDKGLDVGLRIGLDVPQVVVSDAQRIRQLAVNFLANGIKFTESGSVTVTLTVVKTHVLPASDRRPNLAFCRGEDFTAQAPATKVKPECISTLRLEVRDTGIGMTAAECGKLFQPFMQANESVKSLFGGTGLGLSICKDFSESLGGKVWVESTLGEGSSFFAEMDVHHDPSTPKEEMKPLGTCVAIYTPRFPFDGKTAQLLCQASNTKSEIASSIEELLAIVADKSKEVSLVVMGGLVVAQALPLLRRTHPKLPVLLLREGGSSPQAKLRSVGPNDQNLVACSFVLTWSSLMQTLSQLRKRPAPEPELREFIKSPKLEDKPRLKKRKLKCWKRNQANCNQLAILRHASVKILLVEDVAINAKLAKRQLAKLGCTDVTVAETGAQALAFSDAQTFDIIFLDIFLPDMDGFEVLKRMRDSGVDPRRTCFVAMTGANDESSVAKLNAACFDGILMKPIAPAKLNQALVESLEKCTKDILSPAT